MSTRPKWSTPDFRRVYALVLERRTQGSAEPVEMTLAEARGFISTYNGWRLRDVDPRRPPMPEPRVGDEGTVFGHPCKIVAELRPSDTPSTE